jgi:hypothetical protein
MISKQVFIKVAFEFYNSRLGVFSNNISNLQIHKAETLRIQVTIYEVLDFLMGCDLENMCAKAEQ